MTRIMMLAGAMTLALIPAFAGEARAQTNHLIVPQSIRYEHMAVIDRLTKEAAKPGVTAAVAERALALIKTHFAKEEAFVFPPLGLLDEITAGEMPTAEVKKAAIEMVQRTKAAKDELDREHVQITALTGELIQLATRSDEPATIAFASDLATHALHEAEVLQPAAIMVGEYLQSKPAAGE